jgi:hypothetical protein
MEDIIQKAIDGTIWAIAKDDPDHILKSYNRSVKRLMKVRRKLKHPINARTGKPLSPHTIKQYKSELRWHERNVKSEKLVVRLLNEAGFIGSDKIDESANYKKFLQGILQDFAECRKKIADKEKQVPILKSHIDFLGECRDYWYQQYEKAWERGDRWFEQATGIRLGNEKKGGKTESAVVSLKIIDGGKKFEEQPPFATNT